MGSEPADGFWYPPATLTTTNYPANGDFRCWRLMLPPCRIVSLCVEVTTAGSASALGRLGAYTEGADGVPESLAFDAGTVAANSTGAKRAVLATPYVHGGGPLWVGCAVQGAPTTVPTWRSPNVVCPFVHSPLTAPGGSPKFGWLMTGVTAELPATFSIASMVSYGPYVWLEVG
jgi:hypothetical protein